MDIAKSDGKRIASDWCSYVQRNLRLQLYAYRQQHRLDASSSLPKQAIIVYNR